MNVDSILVSEYVSVSVDGKLTVVNAFNQINGPGPKWTIAVLGLSIVVHGHSDEAETSHQGEVRLINEDREVIRSMPFPFDFPKTTVPGLPVRYVAAMTIIGASFDAPGVYAFEVYIDDIYMAAASLVITKTG